MKRLFLPVCALLAIGFAIWVGSRVPHSARPPSVEEAGAVGAVSTGGESCPAPVVAASERPRSGAVDAADLKRRLFDEPDLRKKWAIVCRLATMPETEQLFADPADRRRLDAIIDDVRLAIKRGDLKEAEEEP